MANPLSRIAMGNIINGNRPIISNMVQNKTSNVGNLYGGESRIISDIINRERQVIEEVNGVKAITLEEAAERVKNNR
ncbi:hypothetical protein KQI41_03330 [Tissierella pigra]|uniref:Uncharacterized protein n=1 Tax=Tissierella pigra TaxID=2607614 RepID=A0A6N7XTL3_9FIRM|nr:hypothetical protein [Tissierella pigra]MBU5425436.1 hypothetical protein [Tissierella pigra]MSU01107.1 hypothetical protein [Tissierella pigra]